MRQTMLDTGELRCDLSLGHALCVFCVGGFPSHPTHPKHTESLSQANVISEMMMLSFTLDVAVWLWSN